METGRSAHYSLDARLVTAAKLVLPGKTAADIGSDHMHLPAYLAEQGICPRVIATDKAEAPCRAGQALIRSLGLEHKVDIRRGDGLSVLKPKEAATLIIMGMGGHLMRDILASGMEVAASADRLLLSPQKNPEQLRLFLSEKGWRIVHECIVKEADIYYPLICAEPGQMQLNAEQALYGPCLIGSGDMLFAESLQQRLKQINAIMEELMSLGKGSEHPRMASLEKEKRTVLRILGLSNRHADKTS